MANSLIRRTECFQDRPMRTSNPSLDALSHALPAAGSTPAGAECGTDAGARRQPGYCLPAASEKRQIGGRGRLRPGHAAGAGDRLHPQGSGDVWRQRLHRPAVRRLHRPAEAAPGHAVAAGRCRSQNHPGFRRGCGIHLRACQEIGRPSAGPDRDRRGRSPLRGSMGRPRDLDPHWKNFGGWRGPAGRDLPCRRKL